MKTTRSNLKTTASEAILKGLASDGGLYVFEHLNSDFFSHEMLDLTYQEIAFKVMRRLLDDYSDHDILEVIELSYQKSNFKETIVSLTYQNQFAYLNLYHGKTLAFKDLALSTLPHLYSKAKEIQGEDRQTLILTATSGDTGSAALAGFQQTRDVETLVLYPNGGVSEFQALQMKSLISKDAHLFPVEGDFDNCQTIVKRLFQTIRPKKVLLSSANSINIGRIIPQVVYYVYAYTKLVNDQKVKFGDVVDVVVPTGNFGNIYAAYIAKQLGVPYGKLVIASNENDVLTKLFNEGVYDINRPLMKTISPSMDILISSNFERYLYHLLDEDVVQVNQLMTRLKETGRIEVSAIRKQTDFLAFKATEAETKRTIKSIYDEEGHLLDPHTAVARYCAGQYLKQTSKKPYLLIVSTASPIKFSRAILDTFGLASQESLKEDLEFMKQRFNLAVDQHIQEMIKTNISLPSLDLDEAYDTLKKWIGNKND